MNGEDSKSEIRNPKQAPMTESWKPKTSGVRFDHCSFGSFGFVSDFGFRISSFLLLFLAGCSTIVIPPAHVVDPATVYLTDYGRHSSLLLPASGGDYDEYAFGDWRFFAKGEARWWVGLRALLGSPQATLGRRHVAASSDPAALKNALKCEKLTRLEVSGPRAESLSQHLAARFQASSTTQPVYSSYSELYHVPDETHYWFCHNCNHETADWLRELGCQVRGLSIFSRFVVEPAKN